MLSNFENKRLPPSFNELFGRAMERNREAGERLRKRHAERPFADRREIQAAFDEEMALLAAGEFTDQDQISLKGLGFSL